MIENRRAWLDLLLSPRIEGGFVNDVDDPGGATNLGITTETLGDWRKLGRKATVDEVKSVTRAEAEGIALGRYWNAMRCDQLPSGVDVYAADFAFNSGPGNAAEILQGLVKAEADGFVGDKTIAACRLVKPAALLESYHRSRMAFLRGLPHWNKFGNGWTSRCEQVVELAKIRTEASGTISEMTSSPTVVVAGAGGLVGIGVLLSWLSKNVGPMVDGLPEMLQSSEPTLNSITELAAQPGLAAHITTALTALTALYAVWRRYRLYRDGRM